MLSVLGEGLVRKCECGDAGGSGGLVACMWVVVGQLGLRKMTTLVVGEVEVGKGDAGNCGWETYVYKY